MSAHVAACTVLIKTLMGEMIPVELPADPTVDQFYARVFDALPLEIRPPHALQLSLLSEEEEKGEKTKEGEKSKDEEEAKDEESVGGPDGEDKEGEDQKEQVTCFFNVRVLFILDGYGA